MGFRRNGFVAWSALGMMAIVLSACIGVFEEQPPRYNSPAGAKRAPILNPGGAGQTAPQVSQNTVVPEQEISAKPSPIASAPTTSQGVGPSPLYYYEQQQAAVASVPVSPTVMPETAPTAMPSMDEVSMTPTVPSNEILVDTQPAQEKEPLVSTVVPEAYPPLATVPQLSDVMQEQFTASKEDSDAFIAAYQPSPALGEAQYLPVEATAPEPVQSELDVYVAEATADIQVDEPQTSIVQSSSTMFPWQADDGAEVDIPEQAVLPDVAVMEPVIPVAVEEQALQQLYRGNQAGNGDIVLSEQAVGDILESSQQPYQPVPVMDNQLQQPMNGVDFSTQPLPVAHETDAALGATLGQQPVPAAPVYNPAANTVAVPQSPGVATNVPQTLYTSSGPIRLNPPKPISRTRGTLPQSRYHNLRQRSPASRY